MYNPRLVGILAFDEVEVLDFAGPYEVFNVAAHTASPSPFTVFSLGIGEKPILARGQLSMTPRYSIETCPQPDILVVPGGFGTRALLKHDKLIGWIAAQAERVELLLSVCTGALLLAKAGLLDGLPATTHHTAFDHLAHLSPTTKIRTDERLVQSSARIFTSGGISAGIDLALHVVTRLCGEDLAASVREEMEYGERWRTAGASGR